MFFKMGAAAFLEELQDADPEVMMPILLEKLRVFELKRKSKPILEKDIAMWLNMSPPRVSNPQGPPGTPAGPPRAAGDGAAAVLRPPNP